MITVSVWQEGNNNYLIFFWLWHIFCDLSQTIKLISSYSFEQKVDTVIFFYIVMILLQTSALMIYINIFTTKLQIFIFEFRFYIPSPLPLYLPLALKHNLLGNWASILYFCLNPRVLLLMSFVIKHKNIKKQHIKRLDRKQYNMIFFSETGYHIWQKLKFKQNDVNQMKVLTWLSWWLY